MSDKLLNDIEKLIKKYQKRYGDKGYKLDRLRSRLLAEFYNESDKRLREYKAEYPSHIDK